MTSNDLIKIIRKAVRAELDLYFAEKFGNIHSNINESVKSNQRDVKQNTNQHTHSNNSNNAINSLRSQMQKNIQSLYNDSESINNAYEMMPNSLIGESADIPIDKESAVSALQNTSKGQAVLDALTRDYSSMFKK